MNKKFRKRASRCQTKPSQKRRETFLQLHSKLQNIFKLRLFL